MEWFTVFLHYSLLFFGSFIIVYTALVIMIYSIMLLISLKQLQKISKRAPREKESISMYTKPVSILVPAYNEEAGIIDSIRSLLALRYPQFEIIMINDGSTDGTRDLVIAHFQMKKTAKTYQQQLETEPVTAIYRSEIYPELYLLDKKNGGKSDALNAGLNAASYPYFCSIDGDSILESSSLLKVMKPIMASNEEVVASGGNVRIANGSDIQLGSVIQTALAEKPLVIMQVIEYLRAFLMGRVALSKYNMILIISGAFSVFSKKWVMEAGGYAHGIVGEDMELVVRLHRLIKEKKAKNKIMFVADPVCWTEAPDSLKYLRRQRSRWHRGLLESLWRHKRMTFNPKYGIVGMASFPYYWLIECFGPAIELAGYVYVIWSFFFWRHLFGVFYFIFAAACFIRHDILNGFRPAGSMESEHLSKNKGFNSPICLCRYGSILVPPAHHLLEM